MLRRTLLGSALAVAGGTMLPGKAEAAETLTVVSFGGSYQDAESKALFQPAAKALGITIKEETYAGIADLRLKAKAGAVTWDVVASGSGTAAHAGAEGILEPLDYKIIDVSTFVPNTWQEFAVGGDVVVRGESGARLCRGQHRPPGHQAGLSRNRGPAAAGVRRTSVGGPAGRIGPGHPPPTRRFLRSGTGKTVDHAGVEQWRAGSATVDAPGFRRGA